MTCVQLNWQDIADELHHVLFAYLTYQLIVSNVGRFNVEHDNQACMLPRDCPFKALLCLLVYLCICVHVSTNTCTRSDVCACIHYHVHMSVSCTSLLCLCSVCVCRYLKDDNFFFDDLAPDARYGANGYSLSEEAQSKCPFQNCSLLEWLLSELGSLDGIWIWFLYLYLTTDVHQPALMHECT